MSENQNNDERVREVSVFRKLLNSPELGSISGAILVFVFFGITAGDSGMFGADGILNWLTVSALLGVIAVGACLLMIGGEFDLSIGSMIAFSGIMIAIPSVHYGVPVWLSIIFSFCVCLSLGWLNGYLVIRTKLPSFIVSLAFLYILRGLTIALAILFTNRTIIGGLSEKAENDWLAPIFGSTQVGSSFFVMLSDWGVIGKYEDGSPVVEGIPAIIVWWFVLVAVASFILLKTKYGNWIFAVGGDSKAASNTGVPVKQVKIALFVFAAFTATVYGTAQVVEFGSAAADRGMLKEFEAIIAAVIGGALLTGGYGSIVGAAFGALIFGVVQMGIFFTGVNSDWFRVFLGGMLLISVIFNNYIRKSVAGE